MITIEERANKAVKEKIVKRRIELARRKYHAKDNYLLSLISADYTDKDRINKIQNQRVILLKRYMDYIVKANSLLVDINNYVDVVYLDEEEDKWNTELNELETSSSKLNKTSKRKNKFKRFLPCLIAGSVLIITGGLSILIGHSVKEKLVDESIEEYSDDLDEVIKRATHTKYGNIDYSYGDVFSVDSHNLDEVITYINYDEVANYIKTSEDPDLALFTLYKEYGTSNIPRYNGITNRTCEELEFDDDIHSFEDYIKANGYNSYKEYYKDSKHAIRNDYLGGKEGLENITVKVKKMTK